MKKIMFNDKYGLTQAVLDGIKTMTRRIVPEQLLIDAMVYSGGDIERRDAYLLAHTPYKLGEEIAVAQSYKSIRGEMLDGNHNYYDEMYEPFHLGKFISGHGYYNKMFVRADLMPHRIRITGINVELLQDISYDDCLREGICEGEFVNTWDRFYFDIWGDVANHITFRTPHKAFSSLIDRVSGRGTWDNNPMVFAYEFELLK